MNSEIINEVTDNIDSDCHTYMFDNMLVFNKGRLSLGGLKYSVKISNRKEGLLICKSKGALIFYDFENGQWY